MSKRAVLHKKRDQSLHKKDEILSHLDILKTCFTRYERTWAVIVVTRHV